eukprot:6490419-Prymnesium_polylepis.3
MAAQALVHGARPDKSCESCASHTRPRTNTPTRCQNTRAAADCARRRLGRRQDVRDDPVHEGRVPVVHARDDRHGLWHAPAVGRHADVRPPRLLT